jgi:hypothetical protein
LDEALAQAARTLDPLSFKLQLTRYRGVYRSGRKYVVPFVDTVGIDRRREFATLGQARDFKETIRRAEKAQSAFLEPAERNVPVDDGLGAGPGMGT